MCGGFYLVLIWTRENCIVFITSKSNCKWITIAWQLHLSSPSTDLICLPTSCKPNIDQHCGSIHHLSSYRLSIYPQKHLSFIHLMPSIILQNSFWRHSLHRSMLVLLRQFLVPEYMCNRWMNICPLDTLVGCIHPIFQPIREELGLWRMHSEFMHS